MNTHSKEQESREKQFETCKLLIEEMLLTVDISPHISTKNSSSNIHDAIIIYLLKKNHEEFLNKDDYFKTYHVQGSLADAVLDNFRQTKRIFDGVNGKIFIETRYAAPDSARYHMARRKED